VTRFTASPTPARNLAKCSAECNRIDTAETARKWVIKNGQKSLDFAYASSRTGFSVKIARTESAKSRMSGLSPIS